MELGAASRDAAEKKRAKHARPCGHGTEAPATRALLQDDQTSSHALASCLGGGQRGKNDDGRKQTRGVTSRNRPSLQYQSCNSARRPHTAKRLFPSTGGASVFQEYLENGECGDHRFCRVRIARIALIVLIWIRISRRGKT